jgi:hypothetical protein
MNGRTERTPEKEAEFLAQLSDTANVSVSAKVCGLSRSTVYEWRDSDETFRAAWDAAVQRGTEALIDEAVRRGKDGVTKGIYYQGRRVDDLTEYSDTLLMFMLKARRPELFRDNVHMNHSGAVKMEVSWATPPEL